MTEQTQGEYQDESFDIKVMICSAPPFPDCCDVLSLHTRCTVEEKISSHTTAIIAPDGGGRTRERVPAAVELIEVATDNRPSVPYLVSTH